MKMIKIGLLVLSSSLLLGLGLTSLKDEMHKAKADAEPTPVVFTSYQTNVLDKYAYRLNDTTQGWSDFITTWVNDASETKGINFFDDFDPTDYEYSVSDLRQVKNSVYFDYLALDYGIDVYAACTDEIRCMLDHMVFMKEDIKYLFEYDYYGDLTTEDIEDIDADFAAISTLYTKCQTLSQTIQNAQKEHEIHVLVEKANAIGEEVAALENQPFNNEESYDDLVAEINSIIQEINDNLETLGSDFRLTNANSKLAENITTVQQAKQNFIDSNSNNNIVWIIIVAILGAGACFAGGFFLNKFLFKKQ